MITSHEKAAREIQQWLETDSALTGRSIDAIGHRVVHGGADFWQPSLITDDVLTTLKSLTPLAPNHMPGTLAVMRAFLKAFPSLPAGGPVRLPCLQRRVMSPMHLWYRIGIPATRGHLLFRCRGVFREQPTLRGSRKVLMDRDIRGCVQTLFVLMSFVAI
jgi:hypothetical protein